MNDQPHDEHGIELPQPTSSPMFTAFGFTLMAAGLVTNWVVAVVGFVTMMCGIVLWFRNSNPDSTEMPAPATDRHPTPITPKEGGVDHLLSDTGHRARIPMEIHPYSAGIVGGIIGGAVMSAFAVVWGFITHGSLWYTVNLLAGAMLSGYADMSIEELSSFRTEGLIVGVLIQIFMSIGVGLLYGVTLPLIPRMRLFFSALLVPLMWSGLTWASISIVNPALGDHIEWIWFVASQVVYGVVAGWWIIRSEKIGTMQNWHYLERIGVETPGAREMGADE